VKKAEKESKELRTQLAELDKVRSRARDLEKLEGDLKKLRDRVNEEQAARAAAEAVVKRNEAEVQNLRTDKEDLQTQIDQLRIDLEVAKKARADVLSVLSGLAGK